jgi:hypothetical protein
MPTQQTVRRWRWAAFYKPKKLPRWRVKQIQRIFAENEGVPVSEWKKRHKNIWD